ncbi:MAG: cell filamentation protein Fic, partial [Treponema sp.]|nr:cell filamentation protein Fic [Treponema sp.]
MEKWKRNKNVKYASVASTAKVWEVSERSVRNYCAQGRVPGSLISGKTWLVPKDAKKPERLVRHTLASKKQTVLDILQREKDARLPGGMYHRVQIELTYNSNHIEGSRLSHDQTRYIFETHTIGITDKEINVDDIVETANHFRCVDIVIDGAKSKLTESFIKQLHFMLKNGTSDSRKSWFKIGDYKILENEVGGRSTAKPSEVKAKIKQLLLEYNEKKTLDFDDILD